MTDDDEVNVAHAGHSSRFNPEACTLKFGYSPAHERRLDLLPVLASFYPITQPPAKQDTQDGRARSVVTGFG